MIYLWYLLRPKYCFLHETDFKSLSMLTLVLLLFCHLRWFYQIKLFTLTRLADDKDVVVSDYNYKLSDAFQSAFHTAIIMCILSPEDVFSNCVRREMSVQNLNTIPDLVCCLAWQLGLQVLDRKSCTRTWSERHDSVILWRCAACMISYNYQWRKDSNSSQKTFLSQELRERLLLHINGGIQCPISNET